MEKKLTIKAKPFQFGFLNCPGRYPAFVAGWGTGKTYFGLLKVMNECLAHDNNLWLVVRKEFTDLKDSTMKDFQVYFERPIPSNKDITLDNGSVIMFRHGDELEVLQNINLGGFLIEQAEEFETDEQFNMLRGRLRRAGVPHFGCIIANTKGHNWIWEKWKRAGMSRDPQYRLFEATTFDNRDNLPADFIEDLAKMENEAPSHYNRFVLNSWEDLDVEDKVIPYSAIQKAIKKTLTPLRTRRIVSCDPAEFGGDETVIYGLDTGKVIARDTFGRKEPMETAGRCIAMKREINAQGIVIDPIGVGSGIASRLGELGHSPIKADGRVRAANPETYFNRRAEMWFAARQRFIEGTVSLPDDDTMLHEELAAQGYEVTSAGVRKLHGKEKVRKSDYLGRSPSRADALVYGLWGEQSLPFDDTYEGLESDEAETEMAPSYTTVSVL
jgi:phage terminase large subunit-like protein